VPTDPVPVLNAVIYVPVAIPPFDKVIPTNNVPLATADTVKITGVAVNVVVSWAVEELMVHELLALVAVPVKLPVIYTPAGRVVPEIN
jgi:hypothetical protein